MKKTNFLYASAIMMAFAFGVTSCEQSIDNPVDSVNRGATLSDLIDEYAQNGVLELPSGLDVELTETLVLDAPLTITSKGAPATIIAKAGFVTNSSIVFSNVNIDATNAGAPLVKMNTLPIDGLNDKGAFEVEKITFDGVTIDGLSNQLFYANKQKYLINSLEINNSTINIAGGSSKTIIDFNGGGFPLNVTISKSTIEADATSSWSNGGFFSTQSGAKITDVTSVEGATHIFTVIDSKLTGIAKGKTLCTLRENNKDYQYYVVKDNVVADCGKSGQFLKGFCGGQNINKKDNWTASGNVVTFDGVDKGAEENNCLEGACLVPETAEEE